MRAIEVRRFGPPDVLQVDELNEPVPGPEQVVVAAAACDVLFVDTMIRPVAHASRREGRRSGRGQAKLAVIASAGGVAVDYGLPGWDAAVLEATGGARPAVVLDSVGGAIGATAFGLVADVLGQLAERRISPTRTRHTRPSAHAGR